MLNRKQKIVILVSIITLILSFLFPPWADYFPVSSTHEIVTSVLTSVSEKEKMVVFVGYSSLFSRPEQYSHEFHRVIEYTQQAEKAISDRKIVTGETETYTLLRMPTGKDSVESIKHYDSLIEAGTIVTMKNDELYGFAGIYHELLLIQIALIFFISISLKFVLCV